MFVIFFAIILFLLFFIYLICYVFNKATQKHLEFSKCVNFLTQINSECVNFITESFCYLFNKYGQKKIYLSFFLINKIMSC